VTPRRALGRPGPGVSAITNLNGSLGTSGRGAGVGPPPERRACPADVPLFAHKDGPPRLLGVPRAGAAFGVLQPDATLGPTVYVRAAPLLPGLGTRLRLAPGAEACPVVGPHTAPH
jgi:hypothetical protein